MSETLEKIRRPSWDELFLRHAYLIASKSKDPRTHIGSVLVKENRILSNGYNGFPVGVNDTEERYNNRQLKLLYVAHSEFNAVVQCAYLGYSSKDTTLYTFGLPCENCTKTILQGGVKEIVLHKQWIDKEVEMNYQNWSEGRKASTDMINEAGVQVRTVDIVLGVEGLLNGVVVHL